MGRGAHKSSERNQTTDHMLAVGLRAGGVAAFVLVVAGSVLEVLHLKFARLVLQVGILALMSTPVLRVALSVFAFWREHDYKYMVIAAAVLTIVLLGAILRVAV